MNLGFPLSKLFGYRYVEARNLSVAFSQLPGQLERIVTPKFEIEILSLMT
jgi:hypothetical protein